jgi:hypothetical protein
MEVITTRLSNALGIGTDNQQKEQYGKNDFLHYFKNNCI